MDEEKFRKINQFNKCFKGEDSPSILCICGESGSGKSTLAKKILEYRESNGNIHPTVVLDGDGVRHFVTHDLGYSDEDRIKNNEIIAGIAFLLVVQGFNVIISTVRANVAYNILSQYWNHNIHCFVCDKYTRDTEEYKEAYNNFIKK
jgi:adenylylsulfate kinase-like enzyme